MTPSLVFSDWDLLLSGVTASEISVDNVSCDRRWTMGLGTAALTGGHVFATGVRHLDGCGGCLDKDR